MTWSNIVSGVDVARTALAVAAAAVMWTVGDHATFTVGLAVCLAVPVVEPRLLGSAGARPPLRSIAFSLLAIVAVVAFGFAPESAACAIAALCIVGAAFPFHLGYEAVRPHAGVRAFTLLLLTQPGLALAAQILDPQTVTLDVATRSSLTAWFVLTAIVQTGMALVRAEPMRALFGIAMSQSALLVAGALVSEHGFAAEYLMLAGSDLGLLALALVAGDLARRHGPMRIRPDNGLAVLEPRASQLFLVAGWLFAGLPGGIVFFAEDVIFHLLVERSSWSAAGMVFASVLNAIAFYRVYLGVFCGRMRPGAFASSPIPRVVPIVVVALILATVVFGCFPQWMTPH